MCGSSRKLSFAHHVKDSTEQSACVCMMVTHAIDAEALAYGCTAAAAATAQAIAFQSWRMGTCMLFRKAIHTSIFKHLYVRLDLDRWLCTNPSLTFLAHDSCGCAHKCLTCLPGRGHITGQGALPSRDLLGRSLPFSYE